MNRRRLLLAAGGVLLLAAALRPSDRLMADDRDGRPGGRHDGALVQDFE